MASQGRTSGLRIKQPLAERRERLRELLGRPADERTRYEIGAIVAEIKSDPAVYGSGAVSVVAAAVGEDVASLYRYATVAECWSAEQFEGLLLRGRERGTRLSWSHLVLIASLPSPAGRARWTERTLAERLSVRQLALLLADEAPESGPGLLRDSMAQLARLARASERWLTVVRPLLEAAVSRLEALPDGECGVAESLERAIVAHARLHTASSEQLRVLRAQRARFQRPGHPDDVSFEESS